MNEPKKPYRKWATQLDPEGWTLYAIEPDGYLLKMRACESEVAADLLARDFTNTERLAQLERENDQARLADNKAGRY